MTIETIWEMLSTPFMQRAFVVAILVGFSAPVVGTYLVQRGMALMGDGIGHVALTGVAVGWLAASAFGLNPKDEVVYTSILSAFILIFGLGLRGPLFSLSHDEDFAKACGLRVRTLNILVAVVAALTVSVAMRVVGVLLVSAIMIVPVAIAQLLSSSFNTTMAIAMALGVIACVTGLAITYVVTLAPGATIVTLLIGTYTIVAIGRAVIASCIRRRPTKAVTWDEHETQPSVKR